MYTPLFYFILCVTEFVIEFSILIILSYDMHKHKSHTNSTKSLLRVDLWRWILSPTFRGVSLSWLYALSLLLWESYCSWRLLFIMFITNSDRMFTDLSISFLCAVVSESFLGPHKIQRNKSSSDLGTLKPSQLPLNCHISSVKIHLVTIFAAWKIFWKLS